MAPFVFIAFPSEGACDSLLVYLDVAGIDTFKIKTKPYWQKYILHIMETISDPISTISFKPYTTQDSIDSTGFDIWFALDNLMMENQNLITFDSAGVGNWNILSNERIITNILWSDITPFDTGKSVLLSFIKHGQSHNYPNVTFELSLGDTIWNMNQVQILKK